MHDIAIFEAAYHVDDRVDFTNICKELVAKAFSLGGAFYKSGNIHKLDCRGNDLLGVIHLAQYIQPLIRHGYNAYIRVNGTKRIVGGFRSCFRQ